MNDSPRLSFRNISLAFDSEIKNETIISCDSKNKSYIILMDYFNEEEYEEEYYEFYTIDMSLIELRALATSTINSNIPSTAYRDYMLSNKSAYLFNANCTCLNPFSNDS